MHQSTRNTHHGIGTILILYTGWDAIGGITAINNCKTPLSSLFRSKLQTNAMHIYGFETRKKTHNYSNNATIKKGELLFLADFTLVIARSIVMV